MRPRSARCCATSIEALELSWDPRTAGGVADEVSGVTVDDVERAVLDAYGLTAATGALDAATLERARALEPRHVIG